MEREMEEKEEPLLLLSLKSYSSKSREEMEREKSSQRRRINWTQRKGNEAAAWGVKTEPRSHGGNKLSEFKESWRSPSKHWVHRENWKRHFKSTATSEEGRRRLSDQLSWKWMCLQLFWNPALSSFLTLFPWWLNLILVTLVLPGLLKQRICWEWPHSNILTLPSWAPVKSEKQNSQSFSMIGFISRRRGSLFWLLYEKFLILPLRSLLPPTCGELLCSNHSRLNPSFSWK